MRTYLYPLHYVIFQALKAKMSFKEIRVLIREYFIEKDSM
jgi:hypothetical protein